MLAKEIVDEVIRIAKEKNLKNIKKISLEIGIVSLAHDGHEEHTEDISIENLEFGIKNIIKNTELSEAVFEIRKTTEKHWKITDIEVE